MAQARQEGIKPDTTSYNCAMKGMAIQKQWNRARKLLKRMVSEGLTPDVRTYNGLAEAAGMGSPRPREHMIEARVAVYIAHGNDDEAVPVTCHIC